LTLFGFITPSVACRGPQWERMILLDAVPKAAEASEVIAKVEILDLETRDLPDMLPFHVARARILRAVRGTVEGQTIEIHAEPSSCGGGLDSNSVGRTGFIAGSFKLVGDQTFFFGSWTKRQIGKFP
jgi:hypothetical protein